MSGNPMQAGGALVPHAGGATCGALTKSRKPCGQQAGARTPHPGQGRCYLHGGLTPIKHGRYSSIKHERLRALIEAHASDPDPLNILPELAAARALFQDYLERYEEHTAALLAWHTDWQATRRPIPEDLVLAFTRVVDEYENGLTEGGDPSPRETEALEASRRFLLAMQHVEQTGKPTQLLDIADAYRIVSEVTKIAERIEKVRAANAISRPDLNRIISEMGRVVDLYVTDPAQKQQVREGWLAIRL